MPVRPLFTGPAHIVCAWTEEGECQVEDYLMELGRNNNSDAGAIVHLLEQTSRHGPPTNPQKFRPLKGSASGIVEFKARGGTRVLAFIDRPHRRIVCTHAIPKLKPKRFNREVDLALEIKEAYFFEQALEESEYVN
jgi:hypothetical protein